MIQDKKELILYSLQAKPCDEDELKKRDFLDNVSGYGISMMLSMLERDGKIYYKNNRYYVRKKYRASE